MNQDTMLQEMYDDFANRGGSVEEFIREASRRGFNISSIRFRILGDKVQCFVNESASEMAAREYTESRTGGGRR